MISWMLAAALFAAPAFAQAPDDSETVSGRKLPALPDAVPAKTLAQDIAEYRAHEYEDEAYWGEAQLGLPPVFVHDVRKGLELVYLRDYKGARKYFEDLDARYPERRLSSAIDAVIWQAIMLENFDFRFESQWEVASKQARKDLTEALAQPGGEAFEHFVLAGIVGIEAIHTMRREHYLPALQLAFETMDQIEEARKLAPEFTDLKLADGMYNYWRTVITLSTPILPDFGDHRVEGIGQLQEVEAKGVFFAPVTSLALAFTWMEERDFKRATASCLRNQRVYPDNIVNNLVLGQIYTYQRQHELALKNYDHVQKTDPTNMRVHYWRAVSLLRLARLDEAEQELNTYLAAEYLEDWQRSSSYYRLGQVSQQRKQWGEAEERYKMAVKVDGHAGAKLAIDRLRKHKKEGRIDY